MVELNENINKTILADVLKDKGLSEEYVQPIWEIICYANHVTTERDSKFIDPATVLLAGLYSLFTDAYGCDDEKKKIGAGQVLAVYALMAWHEIEKQKRLKGESGENESCSASTCCVRAKFGTRGWK